MKTEHRLCLVPAILLAPVLVLSSCGQGKPSNLTGANSVSNKLAAITQSGQPVTAKDLDDW